VTLTFTARDGAGNQQAAGGEAVTFGSGGGTSTGTISAVADAGNGTYTAMFLGVSAGTATTVSASVAGSAVTSPSPEITVMPGSYSLSQSTLTRSSALVASGSSVTLTLAVKDASGNALHNGGLSVTFSAAGGTSTGTIGSVTDNANGTYSATFTGSAAGSVTNIQATINGMTVTSSQPTLQVIAAAVSLSQSVVARSAGTVASGSAITLTLTTKDSAGNALMTGGLTVSFSTSGGTSTGAVGSVTDNGNGTYTASFTGGIAGTATNITATIGGSAVTSALPIVTVIAGPASVAQSVVTRSAASAVSGSTVTLNLIAKDSGGNPLTSGGLTVTFSLSGSGTSSGSIGSVTDNGNGTYTATLTATTAGTAKAVAATIGGSSVTSALPTFTVTPGALSLAQSSVTRSSASVPSGSTATFTLTARDAASNQLSTGGLSVVFSLTGGTSAGSIGSVTDNSNGTYTAVFTGVTAGTPSAINATIGGSAVTGTAPSITVVPGTLSLSQSSVTRSAVNVMAGSGVTLTLIGRDAAGNPQVSGGATVTFSYSGGTSTGTIGAVTDNGDGTYAATFTGVAAGTAVTLSATIGGASVTSAMPTLLVYSTFSTKSLSMNGTSNYLSCPASFNPTVSQAFTISFWSKWNGVCTNYGLNGFLGTADISTDYRGLSIEGNCGGKLLNVSILDSFGGNRYISATSSPNSLPINTWFNVVVTYSGSATASGIRIYINGVLDTLAGNNGPAGTGLAGGNTVSPVGLVIGDSGPANGEYHATRIDETATWSRALTPSEIASVYNAGKTGDLQSHSASASLTNWWRLGENTNAVSALNSVGGGASCSLQGGMTAANIVSEAP
jgi:hypothetical protein